MHVGTVLDNLYKDRLSFNQAEQRFLLCNYHKLHLLHTFRVQESTVMQESTSIATEPCCPLYHVRTASHGWLLHSMTGHDCDQMHDV